MVSEGGVTTKRLIQKLEPTKPIQPKLLRVAAYARVSSGKDAMLHSLSAQVSYYNDLIQKNPEWLFCGVYADEAMTGTKENRTEFQKMLIACRNGEINLIITKSISRFARNTVTLLETVRELKDIGVDVYFEEQNIHSMSSDGELMLTILASYAQEESLSVSENQKWRIRRDFQQGRVCSMRMLGYKRTADGSLEIIPEESAIVRRIFSEYLAGSGKLKIANMLNEEHIPTINGCTWTTEDIRRILINEKYAGNMLLQKSFRENHITKRKVRNIGQLPQYYVEESHEPIIEPEIFELVQGLIKKRNNKFTETKTTTFTHLQAKSNAAVVIKIIAGKRLQQGLYGYAQLTIQRVRNTALRQSKSPNTRCFPFVVRFLGFLNLMRCFSIQKFNKLLSLRRIILHLFSTALILKL